MYLLSNLARGKDKEKIKNYLFEFTIGGQCILMKDFYKTPKYRYIILYKENKEDFGNNIDYILIFKDNLQQKKTVDFILNNGLWKYLNKINYTIDDEYKSIINSRNEIIGNITRNGTLNRINELKELEIKNSLLNNPHSNVNKTKQYLDNNNIFKGNKNSTVIMGNNKHIIFSKPQINLVMFCFYYIKDFIEQLKIYSSNNLIKIILENYEYFKQGKKLNDNIKELFSSSNENYKSIILSMLEKIGNELGNTIPENDNNDQVSQFDENIAKNNFMEQHNKNSIIHKLFFPILETKIFCKKCCTTNHKFDYFKILSIENNNVEKNFLISNFLFNSQKKNIQEKCTFCSGEIEDCVKEKQFIFFSQILIVVLEKDQINKFILKNNIIIYYNNTIPIYELICFIESIEDNVYFKINNQWYQSNSKKTVIQGIENKLPIVLFYKLVNNKINSMINAQNENNNQQKNYIIPNNNEHIDNKNINNNGNQMNFNNQINNNNNRNQMNMINKNNMFQNNINNTNIMNNMNLNNMNQMNQINNFNKMNNNIGNFNNMNNNMNNNNMNNNMNNIMNNNMNNNLNNFNMNKNNMNNFNMNNNLNNNMNNIMNNNMNNYNINNNNMNNNMNNVMNYNMNNNMNNFNINNNNMNNNMNNVMNNNMNNNMNNFNINNNNMNNNMNNFNINNNNMNNNNMNNNNMNNINMNNNMNNFNNNQNIFMNNMNNNMNNVNQMNNFNNNNQMINMNQMNNNNNNFNFQNLFNQFNMLSNNLNNNNNNINNNNNPKPKRPQLSGKTIFITFTFQKEGKQIFIDSNENEKFFTVKKDLEEKYEWLKTMDIKYYFKNNEITGDKSLKDLGIKDNSDITIKT